MNADPLSGLAEQMTLADLSIEPPNQVNRMIRLWSSPRVVVTQRAVRKRYLLLDFRRRQRIIFVMKSARVQPALWRSAQNRVRLKFDEYVLDVARRELWRGAEPIAVQPQVFDLLVYLV